MTEYIYKRDGKTWFVAPWNNGEGGRFEQVENAGVVAWIALVLEDAGMAAEHEGSAGYFVGNEPSEDLLELTPLRPARKAFRNGKLTITDSDTGGTCLVGGLEDRWLQSLGTNGEFRVRDREGRSIPVWVNDGGKAGWIKARKQRERDEWMHEQRRLVEDHRQSDHYFVNPYSFAPMPETVTRSEPRGHAVGTGGISGWFDWTLILRSPMLVSDDIVEDKTGDTVGSLRRYPGSSLRGALRSLHETIAGGCMRVLDGDYVPVHREPRNAYNSTTDRLAVVREVDPMTHAVTQVELVKQVYWVKAETLRAGLAARDLHSGKEFFLDTSAAFKHSKGHRQEFATPGAASPGAGFVMHFTSNGARGNDPYHVAVGELSGRTVSVGNDVWERFVDACDGSEDLIGCGNPADTSVFGPEAPEWKSCDVRNNDVFVGRRRKVDGWLGVGDTVWRTGRGDLKMSTIWRSHGNLDAPVSTRMPQDLLPCSDPAHLCPTCAVFGSIRAERSKEHQQAAYRTHVHVGWARTNDDGVRCTGIDLPPLRSPKPSSGGFYLEAPPPTARTSAQDLPRAQRDRHIPRSQWRGPADTIDGAPKKIRGRKYYWHGQSEGGRQEPRQYLQNQNGKAFSVPEGTVLHARITFDNLDEEQLGWLLAAAQPGLLLDRDAVIHVGGGKPLGYGTATPQVENLTVFSPEERYGGGGAVSVDQRGAIAKVKALAEQRGLDQVHAVLANLLDPAFVGPERISYPTRGTFAQRNAQEFGKSFLWFNTHSGGHSGSLVPLPDPIGPDQYLYTGDEDRR